MADFVKCGDCMRMAPWHWCCKLECGKREECKYCASDVRGEECPNIVAIFKKDEEQEDK